MNGCLAWLLTVATILLPGCAQQSAAITPPPRAHAPLLETDWRLVEIEGKPVVIRPGTREPHFVLSSKGSRVRGYAGCNNFSGAFEQSGDTIRFKPLATTRMACHPESDLETRFLSALASTVSYRIAGISLELLDKEGKARMRLEARPPS